jgi:hypothetical protein
LGGFRKKNPKLKLAAIVINDDGDTAQASQWTLHADATASSGLKNIETHDDAENRYYRVAAKVPYKLSCLPSSSVVGEYEEVEWSCTGGGKMIDGNHIKLKSGEKVKCTVTLNDVPGAGGVDETVDPGEEYETVKSVTADVDCGAGGTLGGVDICLLTDLTGSFFDDIANLKLVAAELFDDVTTIATGARFGVAGFTDYGEYPYKLFSPLNPNKDAWINAIDGLSLGAGGDDPESQFDAIVGAAKGLTYGSTVEPNCGWSNDETISRVLVVSTDAPFHVPSPGMPYQNDLDSTEAALKEENVRIIGLKAGWAETELDSLASASGGTTMPLSLDGSDVADAILDGLSALPCVIVPAAVGCGDLVVSFQPTTKEVPPGGTTTFTETYFVPTTASSGTVYSCEVKYSANGKVVGTHSVKITVP